MRHLTVLVHGNSDGVAAASLIVAALRKSYDGVAVRLTHPMGLLGDFREFARGDVVIVDVALCEIHAEALAREFRRYPFKIIYIDHHPPPLTFSLSELNAELIRPRGSEEVLASELTFRTFMNRLSRDYDRVALYGAIGDYADETAWVREALDR